jgi:hypothetical protein
MGKGRRTGAIMAVVATAGMLSVATATPAAASVKDGPQPLLNWVKAVKAAAPTWVKTYWVTGRDVCDAKVTVSGKNVAVLYPSNTETYTSFFRNATLATGDYDYTAYQVTATSKRSKVIKLRVTISYVQLPKGTFDGDVDPEGVPCVGKELARTSWVKLPVLVTD